MIEICSGAEALPVNEIFHYRGIHVADIRLPGINLSCFILVNLKPDRLKAGTGKLREQRQANVSQANYPYAGLLRFNRSDYLFLDHVACSSLASRVSENCHQIQAGKTIGRRAECQAAFPLTLNP